MIPEQFAYLILSVVAEIPQGRVACYSQIASLSGYPKNARLVGTILSHVENWGDFPCHRVIHADGKLVDGWVEQKSLLQREGIIVDDNNRVNMKQYQWKPFDECT